MTGRSRAVVVAMMLWWAFFGSISVSWALGSPWLVDTVLQGDALRLAQERPTWFVVDASFLGGRDPGAGRNGRLPALEPAGVDRFHCARGPC